MNKVISSIVMIFVCFALVGTSASALPVNHGFYTEEVPEDKQESFLSNIELELLDEIQGTPSIACFAVSNDGTVALGFNTGPKKTVYVYDLEGKFLYGYAFSCSGDFGILLDGGWLSVYFCRSDMLVTFDRSGQCVDFQRVPPTSSNNARIKEVLDPTRIECNGDVYTLERDLGIFMRSYSRCVRTTPDGSRTVIYDVSSDHNVGVILAIGGMLLFIALILIRVIKKHRRTGEDAPS